MIERGSGSQAELRHSDYVSGVSLALWSHYREPEPRSPVSLASTALGMRVSAPPPHHQAMGTTLDVSLFKLPQPGTRQPHRAVSCGKGEQLRAETDL